MNSNSAIPSNMGAATRPARRRWLLVLVAAVVAVTVGLGVWWWSGTPPTAEPPLPDLAEVDPEVAEAITAARRKVIERPNNGASWGRLGMVLRAHDFGEEANRCFREAERLDPADARWPYLQGLTLVQTDPDGGIPCLQRAIERCGNHPLAPRLRLAEVLLSQGRLDEAQTHLEQASKAEPRNPRLQLGLGRLALLRGQWQAALEHLDRCVDDEHARRLTHTLRAEAWTRLNDADKAREEQRQAAQTPEDQVWPDPFVEEVMRLQRGLAIRLQQAGELFSRQQYPEAVQLLEETLQRYPNCTEGRLLLGDCWLQQGNKARAEQTFAAAARIDPGSAEAWFRLGCLQALDRPRQAADSFRRTIRLKPDHADAHFNLGHRLKELGDTAGAIEEFRAALRARPDYERARAALRDMEMKSR